MKTFLYKVVLFGVFFFVVDKGAYFFLYKAPELEHDKRLEYIINGKINKDIIILGSSKGASDIIAGQIEKETKLSSYNLSYPGSNVIFHNFILSSLLKFNKKPKKIILVIDNPYLLINVPSLNFRLDRLYPLSKYDYINNTLIDRGEKTVLSKMFFLEKLNKSNLKLKKITPPDNNPIDKYGSMPFISTVVKQEFNYNSIVSKYDMNSEVKENINAFKNIQALCKVNNIELTFVFSPYYQSFNFEFKDRFKKLMLPENKIMVYDTLNPIYKDKTYFYDVSHLMENGAKIFTSELSKFINEN